MNKEIKRLIRDLNKLKRKMRVGTQDRRDINKQIKELKKSNIIETDAEKEQLIKEICKFDSWYATHKENLYKFTKVQLTFYINNQKALVRK